MNLLYLLACKGTTVVPTDPPTPTPAPEGLAINEVMADNRATLVDPANPICPEHDDWVELFNAGQAAVELGDVELSDGGEAWRLPSRTLQPGELLLLWTDGDPEQGELHGPFRVSKSGETLTLSQGGVVLDQVQVPALGPDEVWARVVDGGATFAISDRPTPGEPNQRVFPDDPCFEVTGFDDHAYPCLRDVESYLALAGDRPGLQVVKFDIFDFQSANPDIQFVDSTFYTLHDQYYLFTILNGQPFGNLDRFPPWPGSFATWKQLDDWARTQDLASMFDPDMLRYSGERLFSRYYYQSINGEARDLGVGTVVHRPADGEREAFWGFELEATDAIDAHDLRIYFDVLAANGNPELQDVVWLVRSEEHEALAQQLEADGDPLASRLIRYDELSEPGAVEVYNPGLTAGRVHMVRTGEEGLEDSRTDYVLVLDEIPDYLPPARALVTNVPQTPLSHVALLARSRGIPNVHLAGVTADPRWDAWKRVHAPVTLEATADGGFRVQGLDTPTYTTWLSLREDADPTITVVAPQDYTVELDGTNDVLELRRIAGGKVAGMDLLVGTVELDPPDQPLGLTVRAYQEHLAALPAPNGVAPAGWLDVVLANHPFIRTTDTPLRYAVAEGEQAYREKYPSASGLQVLESFLAQHPAGDLTGDLIRAGGMRSWVETHPLPTGAASALRQAVEQRLGGVAQQGLRFRSSSTVEDIEGFNGAGLYTSHTGFLDPALGPPMEQAILQVFGSYWGYEAVEERHLAGVPHADGAMGVLVHPRFDDAFELANMVLTLTLTPDDVELIVNAQIGSISVANPPTTCPPVLPEQVRVTATTIERLAASTETPDPVLTDAELRALYDQGLAVAERWLALENSALSAVQQRGVVTLDLEARLMAPGWAGSTEQRLVMKQARSLDPSVNRLPLVFRSMPAPVDLLARAASIERVRCEADALSARIDHLYTDPLMPPDVGHQLDPFVAQVVLELNEDLPELAWIAGATVGWDHLDFESAVLQGFAFAGEHTDGPVSFGPTGWSITNGLGTASGGAMTCTVETLWASPDAYLLDQFD